jgi:hypothetical protein
VLDKNPDQSSLVGISEAKNYLNNNTLTSILCNEPFAKAAFLSKLVCEMDKPVIYLDFDLLYSGYVNSEMIPKSPNVSVFTPSKDDWNQVLKNILLKMSNQKSVIIIDSLNGLYSLLDGKNIGRLVNAYIMLIAFMAKESGSSVLFSSMVRRKEKEGWVLSPTGRRIVDTKMTKIYLKKFNSEITMEIIGDDESVVNSIKII